MRAPVDKLFVALAREAGRLPEPILREILPALRQAQKEVGTALSKWIATHDASARFTPASYRSILVQLETAFRSIDRLAPVVSRALGTGTDRAARLALRHLVREAGELSKMHGADMAPIAWDAARIIADVRRTNAPRATVYGSKVVRDTAAGIRRDLLVGVLKGESFHQITKRMARGTGEDGTRAAAAGVARRAWSNYERIVRTEMVSAYNESADRGIRAAAAGDPSFLRLWSAAADRRTCVICAPLDGKTSPVNGMFPGGYDRPPAHPNCRCSIGLWHRDWEEGAASAATVEPIVAPEIPSVPPIQVPTFSPLPEVTPFGGGLVLPDIEVGAFEPVILPELVFPAEEGAAPSAAKAYTPEALARFADLLDQAALSLQDQAEVRKMFENAAAEYGFVNHDAPLAKGRAFEARPGVSGGLHGWDGAVYVGPDVAAAAKSAARKLAAGQMPTNREWDFLSTFQHEVLHGHSPSTMLIYASGKKAVVVIEEVTTEVVARRLNRDLGAPDWLFTANVNGRRSVAYDDFIDKVVGDVSKAAKIPLEEAANKVEAASLAFKRIEHRFSDVGGYLDAFVERLDIKPTARRTMRKMIDGY